jgi:hypothetical protein
VQEKSLNHPAGIELCCQYSEMPKHKNLPGNLFTKNQTLTKPLYTYIFLVKPVI